MEKAKAIEILNKEYDDAIAVREITRDSPEDFDYLNDLLIALLAAIDALEQDNKWISVKDRLPDKDGKYMVWYKGESCICEFDAESQTFGDTYEDYDEIYSHLVRWDDDMHKDITHWMPLPEQPPESEDDAE